MITLIFTSHLLHFKIDEIICSVGTTPQYCETRQNSNYRDTSHTEAGTLQNSVYSIVWSTKR